ncbi:glucose-1-phosphate cytidylyltransferase [Prochlorococcus marinus XMU1412]|uniref:glucose-1-phosphate cytidylyltransferase n=1 Tax=Prochlorococcus marinus TaxID=1219 RepID=UPI001ADB4E86|nr:glucose-1-phosphate cytidylyltransferase [Prochlorococcus marinus]MBO8240500.1 glucose-1-phosphate cytidylyltransferase [Prochlorococcus marinus XMU1412]MBW3071734.1 glucose-1-phosphate cytidylyltransferase [Prochlorococcus marinus str. MU1412]
MKAVILAGGLGTRFSEETHLKPKPMIEIGGKPILWHILKIYSSYGIKEFIICLGYKGYIIKEFFSNYFLHTNDVTFDINNEKVIFHSRKSEDWKVTLIDTGEFTLTGGRLARIKDFLKDESFCFTYGDGVGDIDIRKLIDHHEKNKKLATLTAVQPPGRYGALELEGNLVKSFKEKPIGDNGWINGGFFVLEPSVIDFINGDQCMWEDKPLKKLAEINQLNAYKHYGYWQPMDTQRDHKTLQKRWEEENAPWKTWR